jgi:hypothetical protein
MKIKTEFKVVPISDFESLKSLQKDLNDGWRIDRVDSPSPNSSNPWTLIYILKRELHYN